MEDKDGNLIVTKANKFIQKFKFSLSASEMQVVNFIIANINSPLYDQEFNTLEFNISDFYKMMGIDNPDGKSYAYIKDVIKGLRNKTSDYINFGEYETIVSWIEKPKFYPKSGRITLKLDDDLKPYLLRANGIMQAQLKYYFSMESKYSMRLYELLKSWDGYKELKYDFERLRLSIDAIKKSYEKWNAFEAKALAPAVKEINEHTDITVSYEKITKGRGGKVTHVVFYYDYKPGMRPRRKKIVEVAPDQQPEIKEGDEEFYKNTYGILMEQFPEFTGHQVFCLFRAAIKHLDLIGYQMEEKQFEVARFINPKLEKIKATPEETKSTTFYRLLNMVENNY